MQNYNLYYINNNKLLTIISYNPKANDYESDNNDKEDGVTTIPQEMLVQKKETIRLAIDCMIYLRNI